MTTHLEAEVVSPAAATARMNLGTSIATITARPPTVLAQASMTIDAMGRPA